MAQMNKVFTIPDDVDNALGEVPKFFEAGKIIQCSTTNNIDSKLKDCIQDDVASNASTSKFHSSVESTEKIPVASLSEAATPAVNVAMSSESTKFEAVFSNLKSSKHFENEICGISTVSSGSTSKMSGALLVNPKQRGNPLLKNIRNVPWEFNEMEPDYVMGRTTCALFVSVRYHNLYPNYIHDRLKALGKSYQLRILLVQVDVVEPSQALKDLSVIAILADCTLMIAWSPEEAGNYLETYKMFENKSADLIKEKLCDDNFSQVIDCLTSVRSINKTDAAVLMSSFQTLENILQATSTELAMCPGVGPLKANRLYEALHKPLKKERKV